MRFYTRKLIKPGDLNSNNTLFGGALLRWIDEEAGIYAMTKLQSKRVVTKYISEIDFKNSLQAGGGHRNRPSIYVHWKDFDYF